MSRNFSSSCYVPNLYCTSVYIYGYLRAQRKKFTKKHVYFLCKRVFKPEIMRILQETHNYSTSRNKKIVAKHCQNLKTISFFKTNYKIRLRRCGGSLAAGQTSGAEVPGSNPASPTMILGRCGIV